MSLKEADRYAVIRQVLDRVMGQSDAATRLGISVRQVKRLARAVRLQGAVGVLSKRRGVASNRCIAQAQRDQFVGLVREKYADFGPSLACEYLTAQHGYTHSAETLRGWMIAAGLWRAKRSKVGRIHSPRQRRDCLGELVQIDGSPHAWFEDRAGKCCLTAFIDDATSAVKVARFHRVESTASYLDCLQRYVSQHGRPLATYSDRHSIFTKHDPEDPTPTQFERALADLGIESILAYTPQAKGRVERLFQTLQDRLVKALRLANISDMNTANEWLAQYVAQHNARFARRATDAADAHRPWLGTAQELRRICAHHFERRLSKTLTCQFRGQLLVVVTDPTAPRYGLRNQRVKIIEHLDGLLEMLHEGVALPFKAFARHEHLAACRVADDKTLNSRVDDALLKQAKRLRKLSQRIEAENAQRAKHHSPAPTVPAPAVDS